MIARAFAILSALFLVASVALAALLSADMTLAESLILIRSDIMVGLRGLNTGWSWEWLSLPMLNRPVWLAPAALGLICAGFAASFNLGRPSPSRRTRS